MEDILRNIFKDKAASPEKLLKFGFKRQNGNYIFRAPLPGTGFCMEVKIDGTENISTKIMDPDFHEPYILHLVGNASGNFVGKIRQFYKQELLKIADSCFETHIFKSVQSQEIIDYIASEYGDSQEFLWKKSPNNAIWRRKDTRKWYGVMLTVSRRKFGLDSDEFVEVLNFMTNPGATSPVDFKSYFPAYHMNKKNWCSVILNSAVATEEICKRLDYSRMAASGKKPKP